MARDTCTRCGVTLHTTTEPPGTHLCKDKAARLRRRERQVTAAMDTFEDFGVLHPDERGLAEAIVARLNQLGITED